MYAHNSGVFIELCQLEVPAIITSGSWIHMEILQTLHKNNLSQRKKVEILKTYNLINQTDIPIQTQKNTFNYLFITSSIPKSHIGNFIEIKICFYSKNKLIDSITELLINNDQTEICSYIIKAPRNSSICKISYKGLYNSANLRTDKLKLELWESKEEIPLGSVSGVVYKAKDGAYKLRNLIEFYAHYKNTCQKFSKNWLKDKIPEYALNKILNDSNNFYKNKK